MPPLGGGKSKLLEENVEENPVVVAPAPAVEPPAPEPEEAPPAEPQPPAQPEPPLEVDMIENPQEAGVDEQMRLEATEALAKAELLKKRNSSRGKHLIQSDNFAADAAKMADAEGDPDLKKQLRSACRIGGGEDRVLVPIDTLVAHLEDKVFRKTECYQLPITIAYFMLFGLMLLAHENTVDLSQVEREFRGMMEGTGFEGVGGMGSGATVLKNPYVVSGHKSLDDVDVIQDVYTYMQDALLPLFVQNGAAAEDFNRILSYNQLIGGVTMQMTRKSKVDCAKEYPDMGPFTTDLAVNINPLMENFSCYPSDSSAGVCFGDFSDPSYGGVIPEGFCPRSVTDPGTTGRRLSEEEEEEETPREEGRLLPEPPMVVKALDYMHETYENSGLSMTLGFTGKNKGAKGRKLSASAHAAKARMGGKAKAAIKSGGGGSLFTVFFHEHEGLQVALDKLRMMQANNWMDIQSTWVGIRVFVLNADLGVMCSAMTNIFFAPSGELVPYMVANSFLIEPYRYMSGFAIDGLWFILFLHLGFQRIVGLVKSIKAKAVKDYLLDAWGMVEWGSFLGGLAILSIWYSYNMMLADLKVQCVEVVTRRPLPGAVVQVASENAAYILAVKKLQTMVTEFDGYCDTTRTIFGWYVMFIMIRFFKAFEAQPKLKVVTQTIVECKEDLVHFMIVFTTMFMAFVVAAMMLFGHRLVEYASFQQAIYQCGQVLLGNFDLDELAEESPMSAVLWFSAFIWLMTNIMLNMILAIIMDVYANAKSASELGDPFWTQLGDMYREIVDRKNLIPATEILKVVQTLPASYSMCGVHTLLEVCPSMSEDQANAIIGHVNEMEIHDDDENYGISDATRLIVGIREQVKGVDKLIEAIRKAQKQGKEFEEEQMRVAKMLGAEWDPAKPVIRRLDEAAERRIRSLETRLDKLEDFLNEAMSYMVFRGKEVRNRLKDMEDYLRGQRDSGAAAGGDWPAPSMSAMGAPASASKFSAMPPPADTSRWG